MAPLVLRYIASILSLALSCVVYSISLAKDIKDTLSIIDESSKSKQTHPLMMGQLCEFIRFSNLRRLSNNRYRMNCMSNFTKIQIDTCFFRLADDVTEIFQITSTVLFLGCTGAICLAMLMIQIDIVSNLLNVVVQKMSAEFGLSEFVFF